VISRASTLQPQSYLDIKARSLTITKKRHPDSYHTCYTLAGLSALQYHHFHTDSTGGIFASAFSWRYVPISSTSELEPDVNVFDERDRLRAFHPLYVIPHEAAENMHAWYERQPMAT